jgi:hypothetical protein
MNATPMTARKQWRPQGGSYTADDGLAIVKARAERTMANLDRQPAYIRRLAHEYGWLIVSMLMQYGVTKPTAIECAILTIRNYGECPSLPVCDQMKAERILNNAGWPFGTRPTPTGRAEP